MLATLRIRNLALVPDLTLDLQPGFNAVTGETGAGKSILIGALNLVLGERADRTLIRSGAEACTVEAVFDITDLAFPLAPFLEENGLEPCEEGQLLLKRSFTAAGGNRQFINGSPTTLATLGALGEWLVDIHGPHEHQSLLQPSRQLGILDSFGQLDGLRESFTRSVRERAGLVERKAALVIDETAYHREIDLLRHQATEIEEAGLDPDTVETLEQDHQRASNAAALLELAQVALNLIAEQENALQEQVGTLGRVLSDLHELDPTAANLVQMQEQNASLIADLQDELSRYADRVDLDPDRLQELETRINRLQSLKRKYGPRMEDVIRHGREARERLETLLGRDAELARLNQDLDKVDAELARLGRELSTRRKQVIPKLVKAATVQLGDLGFQQSHISIDLVSQKPDRNKPPSATGFDTVDFQFAPNPGEPPRPLRAIASSGEMARVMLALKTVLAAEDAVPVLVFDEVDANVGGETGRIVGEKMRKIGERRQVLCITHLAPVAAQGQAHYVVEKQVQDGRTVTLLRRLTDKARVQELTRMLGGTGKAAEKHARELLKGTP